MSTFSTRSVSDVLLIMFDSASVLNDFRNNPLRDSLYELVQSQSQPRFAANLSNVDFLSSSGISILVGLKKRVEARGGQIVLYHLQPIVRDVLAGMKLDRFFTIAQDEQRALDSFRPVPTA
jgi:anti-sigma B factor antagonist